MNDTKEPAEVMRIECPPAKDPAVRWFIFAAMMLGFAVYTIYDHYILGNYPKPDPYALNPYLKYLFNHYIPYLLAPLGLISLIAAVRHLMRKLVADTEGIGYAGKGNIPWDRITKLDATRLKEKGILTLEHGQDQKLVLDSWKLQNFRQLVAFIEKKIAQQPAADTDETTNAGNV